MSSSRPCCCRVTIDLYFLFHELTRRDEKNMVRLSISIFLPVYDDCSHSRKLHAHSLISKSLLFFSWSLMQNSLSLNRPFLLPFQLRWRCGGTAIPGKSTGLLMRAVRAPPWIRVGRAARWSFMRRVVFSSPPLAAFPGKRYVGKNRIFPPPMWVRSSQEAMGNCLKASWRNDDARAAQTSPREPLNCSLWSICSLILSSSCCSSVVVVWCRSGEKLGAFHMIGGFGCRDWSVEKLWGFLLAIWELNG